MNTKITIVIPTYNRPRLIIQCLDALTFQLLPKSEFEVIVVSDGPDKRLERIFKKLSFDLNLRYLQTAEKKGPAGARNFGWLHARSPLIAFTDDDCIPTPNWLSNFLASYHQEPLMTFTGQTIVPLSGRPTDYEMNISRLATADFITANCALTKEALIRTGGFDERFRLAWREDSDLEFKCIESEIPIKKIHAACVVHPVRTAFWGISLKEQKKTMYDALLYKKFPQLYRQKIRPVPHWDYYLICLCFILALICTYLGAGISAVALLGVFVLLMGRLVYRRLKPTRKTLAHITEMICTSLVIPFLSVYWRQYGALKFRTRFL